MSDARRADSRHPENNTLFSESFSSHSMKPPPRRHIQARSCRRSSPAFRPPGFFGRTRDGAPHAPAARGARARRARRARRGGVEVLRARGRALPVLRRDALRASRPGGAPRERRRVLQGAPRGDQVDLARRLRAAGRVRPLALRGRRSLPRARKRQVLRVQRARGGCVDAVRRAGRGVRLRVRQSRVTACRRRLDRLAHLGARAARRDARQTRRALARRRARHRRRRRVLRRGERGWRIHLSRRLPRRALRVPGARARASHGVAMVRERRRPLRVHDVHAFREHGHARAVRFRLLRYAPGGEKVGREGLGEPRARRGWDEQVRRRILRRRGPVPGRERQDLPVHDARAREGAGQRLGVALVRQRGRAVLVRHRRAVREHRSARTVRPRERLLRIRR
jgi:hypothetical protein